MAAPCGRLICGIYRLVRDIVMQRAIDPSVPAL